MSEWALEAPERLYVLFEGSRGDRRPVSARARAPRTGIKVRVAVEKQALAAAQVFLLHRRGDGDMVIKASARREPLVELQSKLGAAYEITAIPVLRSAAVQTATHDRGGPTPQA